MKRRHMILINFIFFGLMLFSAGMVYQFMTGTKPLAMLKSLGRSTKVTAVTTERCDPRAPIAGLESAALNPLKKLSVYQQACHSFVTDTMMIFVSTPSTPEAAIAYADQTAVTLKALSQAGIRPLVIAEPSDSVGNNLDFALFANGTYNPAINAYFQQLKKQGITDKQLGIWNPFPEANLPYWNNNRPTYFAPAVNNYLTTLRTHFPAAQTSILLNSATYDISDFEWQNGNYSSLLPYVRGITPGLVDYAGLQGFPWVAAQGGGGSILNAAEFLNPGLLVEMANSLKTKKVWLNTGTFSTKYALDPARLNQIEPDQRKEVLQTIEEQAITLQKKGLTVAVNIFAQDKSKESEETNWSYWANNQPFVSPFTTGLTEFISDLTRQKIDFWLFDK